MSRAVSEIYIYDAVCYKMMFHFLNVSAALFGRVGPFDDFPIPSQMTSLFESKDNFVKTPDGELLSINKKRAR